MKVNMFTKEEMHADQAEFHLLVLILKYTQDLWHRSLISQTDTEANGEWGTFLPTISPTMKVPHECVAVGCAEMQTKGSLFSFHTFLDWKFFQVGYPVDTHTDMNFLLSKGITRLSLGWSLVDGRNSLFGWNLCPCQFYKEYIQTDQRTQKHILAPSTKIKI